MSGNKPHENSRIYHVGELLEFWWSEDYLDTLSKVKDKLLGAVYYLSVCYSGLFAGLLIRLLFLSGDLMRALQKVQAVVKAALPLGPNDSWYAYGLP